MVALLCVVHKPTSRRQYFVDAASRDDALQGSGPLFPRYSTSIALSNRLKPRCFFSGPGQLMENGQHSFTISGKNHIEDV
jgi:hypothetical protein